MAHHTTANQFDPTMAWARQVRTFGQKLVWTERLAPNELAAYRAPLVSKLLAHARQNTQFYRDRIDFDVNSPDSIGKSWAQIPILTRAQAVENYDRLISERIPAEVGQTSGSTGMPLRYRSSVAFEVANCALTERMFRWWRVDGKKSYVQIGALPSKSKAPPSPGAAITSYGWHTGRPTNGVKYSLSRGYDIDTQLDWLLARRPAYLMAPAGTIRELAATAQRRGIALEFDLVFSIAAVLEADTRDLCRSVFGTEIADTYGAQEAGHIAAQCPDCGEYHVSDDAAVVEILRDDGSSAAAGETGRVIVTPLHNYAMPLIRYELGDFAEVGAGERACGRKLPTLRRILGRYRNLFRFRDGTRIWPMPGGFHLHKFMALRQFQIVQTDFDHIEIRYVPEGTPGPVDLAALTQRVRTVLAQPVDVTVHAVDKIERAAIGKFEDCVSLVPFD
jgi:phenylacetate-coenzyme A ligase PaaK-like adenylate-forming protein